MKIFCVIPAYNEGKTIAKVIIDVKPFVTQIVVVDDCSNDNTCDLAARQGAVVLRHIINRGQGAALKTGTEYALRHGAEIILHFDGDGQFSPADIAKAAEPLAAGEADIVFGSRFLGGSKGIEQMPKFKKNIIMPLARLINKLFFGIEMTDPQSGFRAMTAEAAEKFTWEQDRYAHCSEILFEIHKSGLRIKEIPITIYYHKFGQKLSGGFRILKDLFLAKLMN